MAYRNSYFSLIIEDTGITMKYYPPMDGGERLTIEDVTKYLERNRIDEYDLKLISDTIKKYKDEEVLISRKVVYKIDEYMEVMVAPDKMTATARFYPPSDKGRKMSIEEIYSDLKNQNIVYGIEDKNIESYISNPMYMSQIIVANGKKPVHGHDATIEYKFNTDRKAKPQLNENGTVDFHRLNNISHILAGDVLAVLHKEDLGISGKDVYGAEVKPRKVNRKVLKHGSNVRLSEDETELISLIDGHATLEDDRVLVSNVYNVEGDVDNSTGDIDYNGSIFIKGNVRAGFKIRAKGNIEIQGVVEGSVIIAYGDIIIHSGIQGMGRCQIVAGGNLVSKFIENTHISVNGYIETDNILHSEVSARGDIFVRGKKGSIIGGNVRSTTLIEAACIGSPMGTTTCVEVGSDLVILDKVNKLKKEIDEKNKEKIETTQNIAILKKQAEKGKKEKIPLIKLNAQKLLELDKEIETLSLFYEKGLSQLKENTDARINIDKIIYQGCKVTISGNYILVNESLSRCSYRKEKSEIKAFPL